VTENTHQGAHLKQLPTIQGINAVMIPRLQAILASGREAGVFNGRCDAVDAHLMIGGLCFHCVSNRHTFGAAVRPDLSAPEISARHKAMVVNAVTEYLRGA